MILHTVVAHILTRAANILLSGGQKQSFEGNIIMVFDKQYLELIQYKTLIGMILYRTVFFRVGINLLYFLKSVPNLKTEYIFR